MNDIIEIYDNYHELGIMNRKITEGKEIELVKEYIQFRKQNFISTENKKLAIFIESKVNNSYPDIVFVEYDPENYSNWNETRGLLDNMNLKVLYHIYEKGGLESMDIVSQLGITWKDTMLAVEKLYDSSLILRDNGKWLVKDSGRITTHKIEAVEAKLNQWDRVLQQTIINKNFASESYVLSINSSNLKDDILDKFKRFGIGICLKSGENFEIIKKAKKISIPVSFNSIYFNEWIGRILYFERGEHNVIC